MEIFTDMIKFCVFLMLISYVCCYFEQRKFEERKKVFCRLKRQCQEYQEWEYDYNKLFNLSAIAGPSPEGYLVRFPFYILADRDANIIFTETDDPDWVADYAYEIVIGGWENYRTTIRRKREDLEIKYEYTNHIVTSTCPLKALIEITTGGEIRVFIEHKITTVVEARDAAPLNVKYVGFSSLQHSLAQFFYGCQGEDIYTKTELEKNCITYETKENVFRHFYSINSKIHEKYASKDIVVNILFYVEARRAVRLLLSKDYGTTEGYIIGIGRHFQIEKNEAGDIETLADVPATDILKTNRHLTVMVQISKRGEIKVFGKHDHTQFKLLVAAIDTQPYNKLNFLSFSASNDLSFARVFLDCSFDYPFIDTDYSSRYTLVGHPLLDDPEFKTVVDKRNWLVSKCKYYTNPKYEYKDYVPLRDIPGAQTEAFQARIEFYAQGTRNAHVLLSPTNRPNLLTDPVYEFVIGGWTNSRVLIRRLKSQEKPLAQVFIFNTMTPHTPTKYVLEVSHSGNVRIYSEHDKSKPIAAVFDPIIVPVNYVSFAAYDTLVDFFYNCKK